ncbi:MAG: cyclic nucleotide-binding domain-containing protein [Clostridia bacterium]|nr:cyclic nucleotide-binding domain-containing protein [Clostridia bacterium]
MIQKTFKRNDVILKEGGFDDCFYRVVDGEVGVYLSWGTPEQKKISVLGKDQYFGEMGVIEARPRSATVVAESEKVVAEEYRTEDLNRFYQDDPEKILLLMKQIGGRIRSLSDEYLEAEEVLRGMTEADASANKVGLLEKIARLIGVYETYRAEADRLSAELIDEPRWKRNDDYAGNVTSFSRGTIICKQGTVMDCMYYIHMGRVGVFDAYGTDKEVKLAELYPDQIFGEMGMLMDEPRSATVVALEDDTTVEIIRKEDLMTLFEKNPLKVDAIVGHLSYRLRKMNQQYMAACKKIYEQSREQNA